MYEGGQCIHEERRTSAPQGMGLAIRLSCWFMLLAVFRIDLGETATFLPYTAKLGHTSADGIDSSPYTFNWSVSTDRKSLQFDACMTFEWWERTPLIFGIGFGPRDGRPVNSEIYMTEFDDSTHYGLVQARFLVSFTIF